MYQGLNVIELGEQAKIDFGINWIGNIQLRTGVPDDYGVPATEWKIGHKGPTL
jgi:hypothetical protein